MACYIGSESNRVYVNGYFDVDALHKLIGAMHSLVAVKKYQDIKLDFSGCEGVGPSAMIAVAARCQYYWKSSVDISLTLPSIDRLARLFVNTNWAHFIDVQSYTPSRPRIYSYVPVIRYTESKQQTDAVDRILSTLLVALSHFNRDALRAIEWSLNEITDNVINHADSKVGGFVQVTNFAQAKRLEIAVCDAGIGVPNSLRTTNSNLNDQEALDIAIREGVTRDKNFGQGNGLYGSWRIAQLSGGHFEIYSGYARLKSSKIAGIRIQPEAVPFQGTLVVANIKYGEAVDLAEALTFGGKSHTPIDLIELKYEEDEAGNIRFMLASESEGFGTRLAGDPVRRKLVNLLRMARGGRVIVDFRDIPLISSSFADEVFGKLFKEIGPVQFTQNFTFSNLDPLVRGLIDKAIAQRLSA